MPKNPEAEAEARTLGLVQIGILGVINLHPERAYGSAIADEVSRRVGRELADAQIYVALRRLEDQGFVASRVDDLSVPSKRTRGRPRKFYALTASGRRALESAGAYISSSRPVVQSATGGVESGTTNSGPMPAAVVV